MVASKSRSSKVVDRKGAANPKRMLASYEGFSGMNSKRISSRFNRWEPIGAGCLSGKKGYPLLFSRGEYARQRSLAGVENQRGRKKKTSLVRAPKKNSGRDLRSGDLKGSKGLRLPKDVPGETCPGKSGGRRGVVKPIFVTTRSN